MANMSDRTNVVAPYLDYHLHGGSTPTKAVQPLHLRLMTAQGSSNSAGTELSATGYTAGGATMGNPSFGASSGGISANSNSVSWTAGASWTQIVAIEVWDTAVTPIRILQGSITPITLGNGNTLSFAVASITADGSAW